MKMLHEQEQMLAEQKRNIQQRLVVYDKQLTLKQTLKKKIRPLTKKPEEDNTLFMLNSGLDDEDDKFIQGGAVWYPT